VVGSVVFFATAIGCGPVGAYADAQCAAGEGIQAHAWLICQVPGMIACVDADDKQCKYAGCRT